jgi:mannose-6-phosphate isomerase-like protein (cupin superfamily)
MPDIKRAVTIDGELMEPIFYKPVVVPKGWGEEVVIDNQPEYCGKLLKFKKGASFSGHIHILKRESYLIFSGRLMLEYFNYANADRKSRELNVGDCVHIPKGVFHKVTALEESTIIEVSTHHYDEDNYRIEKGDSQK